MAMSTVAQSRSSNYDSSELDRPSTASSFGSKTVIKYIAPRTLGLNHPSSFQGSLRNFALANVSSNVSASVAATTTSVGLASWAQNPNFSTMSPIQSINGERAIDEYRELSKLNQTLNDSILLCCSLDAHTRVKELQLAWLEQHTSSNSSTIERMFRTEMESARQLIEDATRYKSDLERKLNGIHQTTVANDEHYQKLLAKRNAISKDIFDYQRQLAQNRAESEFLRIRLQQFNDEIEFYTVKNNSLHVREGKLRYELDEEIFGKQVLEMELQVLTGERVTAEDAHSSAIDDIRSSIDASQLTSMQPSSFYHEQLNHEVRRMRSDYEKKMEIYREEIHRRFELELHRYQMYKVRCVPAVGQDHEHKYVQFQREKKDVEQQIGAIRARIQKTESEVAILEKKIADEKLDGQSFGNARRHLTMLEQIIPEREKQLNEAIQNRTKLKQQIDRYREDIHRYPQRILNPMHDVEPFNDITSPQTHENHEHIPQTKILSIPAPAKTRQTEDLPVEEGTLVRSIDFNADLDCDALHKIFNAKTIDEVAIIRILSNRSVGQRLQIREMYKNRFAENLNNLIEAEIDGGLKNILKILLLSPVEHDCYELRRVLTGFNTDQNILIEIFLNRTGKQIQTICEGYFKLFKSTLQQDMSDDRDSYAKKLGLALLQARRPDDDNANANVELDDGRYLHQSHARWRIDGSTFIDLISKRSNENLKRAFAAYEQFSGHDIEQSIKMDTDTDLSRALMTIVRLVRNRARFFAYELRKSLKGANTNEDNLNRIIISRCEIDMVQIKSEYEKITKRTLYDHIQTDTSGNYKRVLLELLRQRIEPSHRDLAFKQQNSTQSKEPYRRTTSNQNVNESKRIVQFDRDNQGKCSSLLTLNSQPSKSPYINRSSQLKNTEQRSHALNDEDE